MSPLLTALATGRRAHLSVSLQSASLLGEEVAQQSLVLGELHLASAHVRFTLRERHLALTEGSRPALQRRVQRLQLVGDVVLPGGRRARFRGRGRHGSLVIVGKVGTVRVGVGVQQLEHINR